MILKTCIIENSNTSGKATVKLVMHNDSKFVTEVQEDYEDLFVDFFIPSHIKIAKNATEFFINECVKRFTCNGQFSISRLEKLGEKIFFLSWTLNFLL